MQLGQAVHGIGETVRRGMRMRLRAGVSAVPLSPDGFVVEAKVCGEIKHRDATTTKRRNDQRTVAVRQGREGNPRSRRDRVGIKGFDQDLGGTAKLRKHLVQPLPSRAFGSHRHHLNLGMSKQDTK
jgi:hypothetical protein